MGNVYYGQTFSIQLRRTVDNFFDLQGDPQKNRTHIFLSEIHKFHSSCLTVMMTSGSSKTGRPPPPHTHTHQITPLTGWESDFRKGWSAGSVTSSRHLIHQIWNTPPPPPPRFLTVGVSEGQCVSEQSSNNRWTQCCYCSKNQGNPQRGGRASDWQILRSGCESVSNAEDVIWNKFWREHKFCAKHSRLLKLWGITIHRQKFKCTKLE